MAESPIPGVDGLAAACALTIRLAICILVTSTQADRQKPKREFFIGRSQEWTRT
jgi:hypothetical protein